MRTVGPEVLVALFGSTGIATVLGILYQIWRERHGNAQKDMAGDLTLGELYRESATRAVDDMQTKIDDMHARIDQLRAALDTEREARELLEDDWHDCVRRFNRVVAAWPREFGPPPLDV